MTNRPNPAPSVVQARTRARRQRSIVAAVVIADVAAFAWLLLAMAGLDPALLVIAAFAGWLIALSLVWYGRTTAVPAPRMRMGIAALLGAWAVAGGILLDWIVSITLLEGALGPLDYVLARYGFVTVVLALTLGPAVAAFRAR